MERFALKTVTLTALGQTLTSDFVIPPGLVKWSLHVVPVHVAATPPNVDPIVVRLKYQANAVFRSLATPIEQICPINALTPFTSGDPAQVVRLELDSGSTVGSVVPDGGVEISLLGIRAH